MASDEKIIQMGEPQETPQAITITIMDPSALGDASINSSLVASVEAQNDGSDPSTIVMVPGEEHSSKDILQTVTETHMGTEELPIISSISNPEEEGLAPESKVSDTFEGEGAEGEGDELVGQHCLICNLDLPPCGTNDQIPVFKTQTSTTHRRLAVFLSNLIGQKLTSRKAHSDIMCQRCFNLLDRVDSLEVEIKETKEEIVNKYQETVSIYGGRARRRKPATAKKTDYVFPKVEPEDETDQLMGMEIDGNFEPRMEDLMEEEHDRQEDRNAQDEEWEPEFKRPRIKREATDIDSGVPPKRKRGRPRKDATRPKDIREPSELTAKGDEEDEVTELQQEPSNPPDDNDDDDHLSAEAQDIDSLLVQLKKEDLVCECGVRSASGLEHVQHVLTHLVGVFKCRECECSYTSSPLLARHQRLLHPPDAPKVKSPEVPKFALSSSVKGELCKCGEKVGEDLLEHARSHLTGPEECPVCALRLQSAPELEVHVERKHPHLFSAFLKNEEARKEIRDADDGGNTQPSTCDVCGKVLCNASRLARHRYMHHPEHYPWLCSLCTLAFPSRQAQHRHACPHTRKNDPDEPCAGRKNECSICKVVCKSRVSLKRHIRRAHPRSAAGPFVCPVCARPATSRKALGDHLRCHRRQGFPCQSCGARLKSLDSLNVHMNEFHTHRIRIQCKQCPQVFFSSSRLSYHVKRHHTDRRYYTNLCHLCGKAYPYPSELKLHLRSHRNERPYKCDQCQKTFLKQGDLTYHKRSHTGERPHRCPHCDSRFPRPNTLMNHIRLQHGVTTTGTTTATTACTTATTATTASTACTTDVTSSPATVVVSSAPYLATVNTPAVQPRPPPVALMTVPRTPAPPRAPTVAVMSVPGSAPPRPPAVTVMTVPGSVPRAPAQPTLVPVVEGQLVNTVVGGSVTEMQPVQYVQVNSLPAGQTVQAVPHTVQGVEYGQGTSLPYQIVHLQILQ